MIDLFAAVVFVATWNGLCVRRNDNLMIVLPLLLLLLILLVLPLLILLLSYEPVHNSSLEGLHTCCVWYSTMYTSTCCVWDG
jgi:hypothetical protein